MQLMAFIKQPEDVHDAGDRKLGRKLLTNLKDSPCPIELERMHLQLSDRVRKQGIGGDPV